MIYMVTLDDGNSDTLEALAIQLSDTPENVMAKILSSGLASYPVRIDERFAKLSATDKLKAIMFAETSK